jgi:hypothetical protein
LDFRLTMTIPRRDKLKATMISGHFKMAAVKPFLSFRKITNSLAPLAILSSRLNSKENLNRIRMLSQRGKAPKARRKAAKR